MSSAEAAEKQRVETLLLRAVDAEGVPDSFAFAQTHALAHELVVGVMKSLLADSFVAAEELATSFFVLKDEARDFLARGSPEVQVFHALPAVEGLDRAALEAIVGAATLKVGQGACMKNRWIRLDKVDGKFYRNVRGSRMDRSRVVEREGGLDVVRRSLTYDECRVWLGRERPGRDDGGPAPH